MEVLTACDRALVENLRAHDEFFWLDLAAPTEDDLSGMEHMFGIHPAAAEDSREWRQLPKADSYGEHLLIVFFTAGPVDGVNQPIEVHVYVSGGWVITIR